MAGGVPAGLTPGEGRRFGLVVGSAFLVLGGVLWWRTHHTAASAVLLLGTVLVLAGLLVPGRLGPVYRAWMALALLISKVTTPVFMGIVYFLVITPIGLLARLAGHRPVSRPRGAATHWQTRPSDARRSEMNHQF